MRTRRVIFDSSKNVCSEFRVNGNSISTLNGCEWIRMNQNLNVPSVSLYLRKYGKEDVALSWEREISGYYQ